MSMRLQVVIDDTELAEIRSAAARHGMTVSAWVRQAIRVAHRREPAVAANHKLEVIRRAVEHAFPTGDIDQMLADTERGYLADAAG
ncbi:MAG: hypothetical protein ACR2JU_00155 [Nocardioidaceae bacterium]